MEFGIVLELERDAAEEVAAQRIIGLMEVLIVVVRRQRRQTDGSIQHVGKGVSARKVRSHPSPDGIECRFFEI